jgi:hypothetical protein
MIIHKGVKYLMIALAVIAAVMGIMLMFGNNSPMDSMIYFGYLFFIIGLAVIVFFSITNTFSSSEILKRTLFILGLFLVVLVVSYVIASGEAVIKNGVQIVSESASKWIDTGLIAFYILAIISALALVFSGFKKLTN